ncbi:MAG: flavin reductase family protein [Saprospiraceae bacterium]
MTVEPGTIPTKDLHQFILAAVAPRPIAFASTVSADGVPNLAPYSFFNAFSSNPPILIFSSNRRVANNTTKDTLANVEATGEVVINVVSHHIARQMALCSIEWGAEVDEFRKSGLTPLPSERVRPFRVAESPVQMECRVDKILPLGKEGGAGNLIVCEILLMHIADEILTATGRIDPHKIDLVGRMGRFYYARASGAAVEEIVQEVGAVGALGFDRLPDFLLKNDVLTGNNLAELAALPALPSPKEAAALAADPEVGAALASENPRAALLQLAKKALDKKDVARGAQLAVLAA